MSDTNKRKTNRGCGVKWTNDNMAKAVEEFRNGSLSLRKAADKYAVPKSTLELKAKGWKGRPSTFDSESGKGGRRKTIPQMEEEKLATYLKVMSKWGFGLGKNEVLDVVQEFVQKNGIKNVFQSNRPGRKWFKSFTTRYHLSLKKPELIEGSRASQASDPFIVNNFFEQLLSILTELQLGLKPESIYNCDESAFKSDPTRAKILTAKGKIYFKL